MAAARRPLGEGADDDLAIAVTYMARSAARGAARRVWARAE